jgi:predicted nucleic acid-binding protein
VISRALADTGPLVAIVRTREKSHKKCAAALKAIHPPLLTCWPVLTEAAYLLRDEPDGFAV